MLSQTTVLSDWPHHKPCTIQLTTERLDTSSRLLALALLELELLLRKHPGFLSAWGHHGVCVCVAMKAPAGANCLGLKTVCPHTGVNYQGCWKWKRRCSESKSHQELLRQSKAIKYWGILDKSKCIFIHHPSEKWSTYKQEDKLALVEANFPVSLRHSSQIVFGCFSISVVLVPKMLNGKHLQGQE